MGLSESNTMLNYATERETNKDGAVVTIRDFYNVHVSNGPFLTTDSKYYAYKIRVIPKADSIKYSADYVTWSRLCIGEINDMYTGKMMLGQSSSSYQISEFWVESNYAVRYYYLGNLAFMHSDSWMLSSSTNSGADISLNAQYDIVITPYSYSSYMGENIGNQVTGNELAQKGNDLAQKGNDLAQEGNEIAQKTQDQQKSFFDSFFQDLFDTVIHLFIPTHEEMAELLGRLNDFFAEKFGFLYYPFDVLADLFDALIYTGDPQTVFTFPGFSIMGYQVWDDIKVDLYAYPIVKDVFAKVRMVMGGFLSFLFIQYLRDFFEKRFGGGG